MFFFSLYYLLNYLIFNVECMFGYNELILDKIDNFYWFNVIFVL